MEVSDYILNEIADHLDTGFRCYLNKKSLELVTYPSDSYVSFEPEMWEAEIRNVKKSIKDFIEILDLKRQNPDVEISDVLSMKFKNIVDVIKDPDDKDDEIEII